MGFFDRFRRGGQEDEAAKHAKQQAAREAAEKNAAQYFGDQGGADKKVADQRGADQQSGYEAADYFGGSDTDYGFDKGTEPQKDAGATEENIEKPDWQIEEEKEEAKERKMAEQNFAESQASARKVERENKQEQQDAQNAILLIKDSLNTMGIDRNALETIITPNDIIENPNLADDLGYGEFSGAKDVFADAKSKNIINGEQKIRDAVNKATEWFGDRNRKEAA